VSDELSIKALPLAEQLEYWIKRRANLSDRVVEAMANLARVRNDGALAKQNIVAITKLIEKLERETK
jgi:hypothetical protein